MQPHLRLYDAERGDSPVVSGRALHMKHSTLSDVDDFARFNVPLLFILYNLAFIINNATIYILIMDFIVTSCNRRILC